MDFGTPCKIYAPWGKKKKDSISSIAWWCKVSTVCYAWLHNIPDQFYWKNFHYLYSETFHSLILMWLLNYSLKLSPIKHKSKFHLPVIAQNKFLSQLCLFYSVVYQRLHWPMLCYYVEITGHHCYTLPLCRLDFSNDSDECPELNVDPTTNRCSVWMNDVTIHLHIHMRVHMKYINSLHRKLNFFPQIHHNHYKDHTHIN